jgi:predicted lipid-binding transport protein (Tim44 family)
MMVFNLFSEYQFTGLLLILSLIVFAIGAGLPFVGAKGRPTIYMLTAPGNLRAVAASLTLWRWGNKFMGAAIVVLLAGSSMLTTLLEKAGEVIFSRLGLIGLLVASVLWLVFSVFRGVVTVRAAQDVAAAGTSKTGAAPAYYAPLAQWMFALYLVYAALGFLALAAYGVSLLQVGLLPAWVGWATLIFSIALLIPLFIQRNILPILHYLPGLLIGVLLLVQR